MRTAAQVTEKVKEQYEALPYPPRDPEKELEKIHTRLLSRLDQISYFCFEGKLPENMRVLVAGGGTGDSTIYLAEQLKERGGTLVHLDLSAASLEIAEARAEKRKLDNVQFINDSIYNIESLKLGQFDYIDCIGVLHHLPDPLAGLKALKRALKDDGAMGIMLYAPYGRLAVYQMQTLLKLMIPEGATISEQIDITRRVINQLPPTNWFKMSASSGDDHMTMGDSGLFDLLLHSQDKPFSVKDIYELCRGAEMELLTFIHENNMTRFLYYPEYSITDPAALSLLSGLDDEKKFTFMEIFHGRNKKQHCFYLAKNKKALPSPDNRELVPYFSSYVDVIDAGKQVAEIVRNQNSETAVVALNDKELVINKTRITVDILAAIDGVNSLNEIVNIVKNKHSDFEAEVIAAEFSRIFNSFAIFDWLFLRDKNEQPVSNARILQEKSLIRARA